MVKEVVFYNDDVISADDVNQNSLVYSMKDGSFSGMIVHSDRDGFIHQVSCGCGSCGYFETIKECMKGSLEYGHTFFVA